MIYPEFIKKGDTIGVTAPSAGSENEIDIKKLNMAEEKLKDLGFTIEETENCRKDTGTGRSASKEERAKQLNKLFIDEKTKAIIGLAGGEFLIEMLPYVDFKNILNNPKWLQGYSDITGLLFPITTMLDIATIYSNNFKTFAMKNWHRSIKENLEILQGNIIKQYSYDLYEDIRAERINGDEPYNLTEKVRWEGINGEENIKMQGRMIGGCLDVILCLIGTKYDNTKNFIEKYKKDGIIWFFDNCELSSESLVRAMFQLKEAGYFKYTKGIVFGRSGIEKSYYNISFKNAIKSSLAELNVPIIINADIGHKPPQMTIINGAIARIELNAGKGSIEFKLK